jgi:hypothetical protein
VASKKSALRVAQARLAKVRAGKQDMPKYDIGQVGLAEIRPGKLDGEGERRIMKVGPPEACVV